MPSKTTQHHCVQCKGAARRAEKLQRLEKEQARRASQESTNDGVGQLKLKSKRSKKKDRKKEKRSRA
ncbi:uncharacterized protein CTHT_0031240 [Thermochaetoides thermophila DSM 1495]|uniref:Uncharacterized protein n=1 Tax=Chaetomium thermophilum (strain DSM 1495 / CBS 144.50 / IMI 039719) TaxID=759272 RepID=G0S4J6_CHATD|nr:hypothetical protein CTHT_0031240 [Thermochaetoides thermophila DSM 1495]EGS21271.1 hypothetical protein CTHT_0031240 [Thermochaetoides thermophila DSM 1495]